jgi:hypothetical protein
MMSRAVDVAKALRGTPNGRGFLCRCPCPTHGQGKGDRHPSLSITDGDDQLLVHCHAGCDSRDIIAELSRRGLWAEREREDRSFAAGIPSPRVRPDDSAVRSATALRLWREAKDPRVALVGNYLTHRGLPPVSADLAETVFRFHPNCPFRNERVPCLIACLAPIEKDDGGEPAAITRTRLDRFDGKDRRLTLGPAVGRVVKLSADADVTIGLGIAESVEKGLALIASGWSPIWATIGTSTMRTFPGLSGVEALTVFCDRDDPGRDAALTCAKRWRDAGTEVRILQPPAPFKDWDDWWKGGAP